MSGSINLTGPSTTPGAPQITPAAIDAQVNAALLVNAQLVTAERARAMAAEASITAALALSTAPVAFTAAFLAWMAQLPTSPPAGAGHVYSNGGVPCVTVS